MVRYILKQKFWTTDSDFAIKNAAGVEMGKIDGNLADTQNGKLRFVDTQGKTYAEIKRFTG